jgi:DNA-binding NarL/FixJ family response regulator
MKKRILVVDDHPQVAELLAIYASDRYEVVAATDIAQMNKLLAKDAFDLVVLDLDFKDGTNGLDHIAQIQKMGMPVLVFSGTLEIPTIRYCFQLEISGVMDKREKMNALATAIDEVLSGRRVTPDYVLSALARNHADLMPRLSKQQQKVLHCLLQTPPMTGQEIAIALGVSPSRVSKIVRELGDKLHVDGRNEIIREARRRKYRATIPLAAQPRDGKRRTSQL